MQLVNQNRNGTVLEFTPDELATMSNALNESLEGIEEWEFATRMGATRAEVMELLDALNRLQSSGQVE
jgi:hypothetical protein